MAGCFFGGGINEEPVAEIERTASGTVFRGADVSFRANKSLDPDGDTLTVDWAARACAAGGDVCDQMTVREVGGRSLGEVFTVVVPPNRNDVDGNGDSLQIEALRVEIRVEDPSGAQSTAFVVVDVVNQAPTVTVTDQGYQPPQGGGYPIGVEIELIARGTDGDDDVLVYDWELVERPMGSVPEFGPITLPMADSAHRLLADIPGQYDIEVTVTDPLGLSDTTQKTVYVEADRPPCIRSTDPFATTDGNYIVDTGEPPKRFAVGSVEDDLDYYPAPSDTLEGLLGEAEFTWFISSPATSYAWTEIVNHEVADYLVDPAAYDPGDILELRVEVDDRIGRDIVCDPALPTCAIGTDTECLQRVTWGVEIR
jgi:hypothetical protein